MTKKTVAYVVFIEKSINVQKLSVASMTSIGELVSDFLRCAISRKRCNIERRL